MKKLFLTALLTLFVSMPSMQAIPAHKGSVTIKQPDGTTVTIRLHGDEYRHYTTTDDGYSVVKNNQGYYVYAQLDEEGQLEPTRMVAHDSSLRQPAEKQYLQGIKKKLIPAMTPDARNEMMAERVRQHNTRRAAAAGAPKYDYNNFRGLVILVEYNDKSFSRDDYNEIMNNMINEEGYTGYINDKGLKVACTGSVRDYFSDNSNGMFQPQFDVCGPYKVNYSQYYPQSTRNANTILNAAVNAADKDIDFSKYDGDGDGVVDLVYFIMAGNGANYGGNDSRLWWPHRSVVVSRDYRSYLQKDGVYLWDYASSVELYGFTSAPETVTIDGIGTICHEFSHVLGLPDFYDADYEDGGGQSADPGEWSVMAGGSYFNNSRTPVGYNLFERYATGFATPEVIEEEGKYTLANLANSNTGYRLNSTDPNEYFLLENRQQSGWDAYLPGHGMLVFRVDSSNVNIWDNNQVNNNPEHNYFEILRADGYKGKESASDPFPGTKGVRQLNNETSPANLMTWSKAITPIGLENIRETNGNIVFDVVDVNKLSALYLDDSIGLGVGLNCRLVPECYPSSAPCLFEWSSDNPEVAIVTQEGVVTGIAEGNAIITVKDSKTNIKASVNVNVFTVPTVENVSAFLNVSEEDSVLLTLEDAQVLHVYKDNVYLRDASGSIVLADAHLPVVQAGDMISGAVYGKKSVVNGVPQLACVDNIDNSGSVRIVSTGNEFEPRKMKLSELTSSDYSDYVTFLGVELQRLTLANAYNGQMGYFIIDGDTYLHVDNTFKLPSADVSIPTAYSGKKFDVTGILTTILSRGKVVNELGLLHSVVESKTEEINAIRSVSSQQKAAYYSLKGMPLNNISHPGIYLVRQGGTTKKVVVK